MRSYVSSRSVHSAAPEASARRTRGDRLDGEGGELSLRALPRRVALDEDHPRGASRQRSTPSARSATGRARSRLHVSRHREQSSLTRRRWAS